MLFINSEINVRKHTFLVHLLQKITHFFKKSVFVIMIHFILKKRAVILSYDFNHGHENINKKSTVSDIMYKTSLRYRPFHVIIQKQQNTNELINHLNTHMVHFWKTKSSISCNTTVGENSLLFYLFL